MGQTAVTRFGYGVKLTDGPERAVEEYDDLEYFLKENYPLLADGWSGNAWSGDMETWVFVASTLVTKYDYAAIKLTSDNFTVPEEGLAQLADFIANTPLAVGTAQWGVLTSVG